jgi:hypothetical protein
MTEENEIKRERWNGGRWPEGETQQEKQRQRKNKIAWWGIGMMTTMLLEIVMTELFY